VALPCMATAMATGTRRTGACTATILTGATKKIAAELIVRSPIQGLASAGRLLAQSVVIFETRS